MSQTFGGTAPAVIDMTRVLEQQATCPHPLENILCQTITIGCLKCGKHLTLEEYKAIWNRDQPKSAVRK